MVEQQLDLVDSETTKPTVASVSTAKQLTTEVHVAQLDCQATAGSGLVVATYDWAQSSPCGHADQVAAVLAQSEASGCFDSKSPVRIHAHNVVSTNHSILSQHVMLALRHIAQRPHIRIVNLSWGGVGEHLRQLDPEREAANSYLDIQVHHQMKLMAESGVVFVSSAGNAGPWPSSITAPAHLPFVIAVGSAQVASRLLLQSSMGPPPPEAGLGDIVKPDCVALAPLVPLWPESECVRSFGTSFTAPRVASYIASAMSSLPDKQFAGSAWLQIVHSAGRPVPGGSGWQQGAGLVTRSRILASALIHEPHLSIWPPRIAFNDTTRRVVLLHSLPGRHCESPMFGDLLPDEAHFARDVSLQPSSSPWLDVATSCGEVRVQVRSLQANIEQNSTWPDMAPFLAAISILILLLMATANRLARSLKTN